MNYVPRIARYVLLDVLRNRWVVAYFMFFVIATDVLLRLAGTGPRALASLLNLVLLLIPLVTIVFGTIYWHGQREFSQLLLTQPVDRPALFHGLFAGLVIPLSVSFAAGLTLPLLIHRVLNAETATALLLLLIVGIALTGVFGAIAVLIAGLAEDRLRGLGVALGIWLVLAVAYDGFLLWVAVAFRNYPIEQPLLFLSFANPVDLARVLLLLHMDVAALMGATGAVFQKTLGGSAGTAAALGGLALWTIVPGLFALRAFKRRDF